MKVEILKNNTFLKGKSQNKGDIVEINGSLVKKWFKRGIAKKYQGKPEQPVETATKPSEEKAVKENELSEGDINGFKTHNSSSCRADNTYRSESTS